MNRPIIYPFHPSLHNQNFQTHVHFPDFFKARECDKIKALMKGGFRAQIEGLDKPREDMKVRGTTVFGIEPVRDNLWIFERLQNAVIKANFDLWGFDLAGFCEGLQISKYNIDDHYDWHMDIGSKFLSQRKLSIVAQLTDPKEYDGGELEFFRNGDAPREIGTLVLFPSYIFHRVRPITRGIRHSLVGWLSGNPYK